MTRLRRSLQDYLKMRRGLGFKLYDTGIGLLDFVAFMERKRASRIKTTLALEWAQQPKTAQPAEWARRLRFVRGFARYRRLWRDKRWDAWVAFAPAHNGGAADQN